jgi:hypothetical protein
MFVFIRGLSYPDMHCQLRGVRTLALSKVARTFVESAEESAPAQIEETLG